MDGGALRAMEGEGCLSNGSRDYPIFPEAETDGEIGAVRVRVAI